MTTLTTGRLVLTPMTTDDFTPLCRLWSHPDFVAGIGVAPMLPETVWLRLLRDIGHWQVFGFGNWAVTQKDNGAFIGTAGIFDYHRDLVPAFEAPEAGWGLDPAVHGQGYAFEAMLAVLAHADTELNLPRTVCMISHNNVASLKLARRLGFESTGAASLRGESIATFARKGSGQ